MTPNAIDLTTLLAVKSWAGIPITVTDQDQNIQDAITAFSAYVLHATGRGPQDASVPATSPFKTPVAYDDFYDGSGTMRQPIRNWPITAVTLVQVNGQTIQQSTSVNVTGWVIDGDKKFISIRGGMNPTVATFQNYRYQGGWGLGVGPGFCAGVQNVEVQYSAGYSSVPFDLEMCARKVVALNYKRKGWIGLNSEAMAEGAGTVSYSSREMEQDCMNIFRYYRAYVS